MTEIDEKVCLDYYEVELIIRMWSGWIKQQTKGGCDMVDYCYNLIERDPVEGFEVQDAYWLGLKLDRWHTKKWNESVGIFDE